MKKLTKLAALAAAITFQLTATACTSDDPKPPAPTPAQTITLRIGTDDDGDVPTRRQIEEYARQVKSSSSGKLLIEPVYKAAGDVPRQ